jgi:selenocysteine-specific elongation factor
MVWHSYILATAGHVDHGKSALVKALTGVDPDRLPEEKARGITIDLGFAHVDLAGPLRDGVASTIRLGIVDVPGHEDFVKNMVAGVGSVDLALLVVAADDGWMPQTEEHLQILTYLGVRRAVIAMTKIDLAATEETLRREIREQLRGTAFSQAPLVATSILSGRGIEELKRAIAQVLAEVPPQRDLGKPRLPIDRAFSLRGVGTVVTGTLIGGGLERGQSVIVQPAGIPAKIRSIQTHNQEVEQASSGMRIALNLPDLALAGKSAVGPAAIGRGDVVTLAQLGNATQTVDVLIERSSRLGDGIRPIKDGARVRIHHASANLAARIFFVGRAELLPGHKALAQLRLEAPAFLFAGDRFVIRDWPQTQTLAGGRVLNPAATRAGFRTDRYTRFLNALEQADDDAALSASAWLSETPALSRDSLLVQSGFASSQISEAVAHLANSNAIIAHRYFIADAKWWQELIARAAAAIDQAHKTQPQLPGLALSDLRIALAPRMPAGIDLWPALVAELLQTSFAQNGAFIGRKMHEPALPAHLAVAGAKIRATLRARPMDPPSRKELAPDSVSFAALKFLLQTGEAVDISADVVLHRESYLSVVEKIRSRLKTAPATVSELKQLLGSSRRVVVPLLEKLDREGITRRQGDLRVLT